ncbi:MAG: hypothetical protein ACR2OM_05875, partial [Aestuariivirgaceae bacterium]
LQPRVVTSTKAVPWFERTASMVPAGMPSPDLRRMMQGVHQDRADAGRGVGLHVLCRQLL